MNHANYMKWMQEKLIPNLESKTVIVVDNASYHKVQLNRHPTCNARKGEMLFWLDKRGIWYSSDMTKAELYNLIKMHKPQYETFAIDCSPSMDTHSNQTTSLPFSFNLFALGFKCLQSTFVCDIIFARHLNFSTWFTKKLIFREPRKIE